MRKGLLLRRGLRVGYCCRAGVCGHRAQRREHVRMWRASAGSAEGSRWLSLMRASRSDLSPIREIRQALRPELHASQHLLRRRTRYS